jgi:hypothetical protein
LGGEEEGGEAQLLGSSGKQGVQNSEARWCPWQPSSVSGGEFTGERGSEPERGGEDVQVHLQGSSSSAKQAGGGNVGK